MSTLSVPLTKDFEKFIDMQVKLGLASNKADVVRKALLQYEREEAIRAVLESAREVKSGKILKGDIDELARKIK